nr:immunoglobulin heavy chain junction region [Mus musculus]
CARDGGEYFDVW